MVIVLIVVAIRLILHLKLVQPFSFNLNWSFTAWIKSRFFHIYLCAWFVCVLPLLLKVCATDELSLQTSTIFFFPSHILTFHLHLFPFSSQLVLVFWPHNLIFSLPASSHRALSLPLCPSLPLLSLYFHLWALSLHPLSPSSPPILICSSLHRKREKERVFRK